MAHPYDELTEERLRQLHGAKWNYFPEEVLPLWVADMDFPVAEPIRQAIRDYADQDDFGYPMPSGIPGLLDAVSTHFETRHGVRFEPDQIYPASGIIPAIHLACTALAGPGDEVIIQPPVYPPFAMAVQTTGRKAVENPMKFNGGRWELDLEQLESVISPATRLLIFCNPQNPTGRVFTRQELEALGEIVVRHNLWVLSDELHADLVLDGKHVPLAAVSPELAQRTITLFGPTKTFNIAGLKVGFAMSHNQDLLDRFKAQAAGVLTPPNVLAQAAARAAFTECGAWHADTLDYLRSNRQLLKELVAADLPGVRFTENEGTYLAWLDFREVVAADQLDEFLLKEARVSLNDGSTYGEGGAGFARINLATSSGIIREAVGRIAAALEARTQSSSS